MDGEVTGGLPPYAGLLDITVEADDTLAMPFGNDVMGRPGFLHGGAIAGLLEIALHKALRDALGEDREAVEMKPINMTITYMRGGREAITYASARVNRVGTRVANVEAFAWQEDESAPIATATCNVLKG